MQKQHHKANGNLLHNSVLQPTLLCFFILLSSVLFSQNKTRVQLDSTTTSESNIHIDFTSSDTIRDLLVLVYDAAGDLIYLDHQHNFSGIYAARVPVKQNHKNEFRVTVRRDDTNEQQLISPGP